MCLCECEEWEDGEGFYLGATQLQITHQITPIMIKAQERGLTFFLVLPGHIVNPLHMYVQREKERVDGGSVPSKLSTEQQMSPNSKTPALLSL